MTPIQRRSFCAAAATFIALPAWAAKTYGPGASDTEIRIGNTSPYSGPLSLYGLIGRSEAAYFKQLNEAGGINGRKINFLSYDDAYSPPKAIEQIRKLVEGDGVLAIFGMVGSPSNAAVMKYLNGRKVPQLFAASGAAKFADPHNAPWTLGWIPSYQAEGRTYVKHILANNPKAKVGIVFQSDDFGKDYLAGVKQGLAGHANELIEAPFETSSPTLDSQIVKLKDGGADAVIIAGIGKFASQAIRKIGELGWKPARYVTNTAISVDTVLKPAGLDIAAGLISIAYKKDPSDPSHTNDPDVKAFFAFMDKAMPGEPKNDQSAFGYMIAKTLEQVLRQCGDDLTRENVLKQAESLRDFPLPLLLPGITLNTTATNHSPIGKLQMQRFDGHHWSTFGELVDTEK